MAGYFFVAFSLAEDLDSDNEDDLRLFEEFNSSKICQDMRSKFGKSYNRRHSIVSSSPRPSPAYPSSAFDPSLLNDQTEVDTVVSSNIADCDSLSVPPRSAIDLDTNAASNKKVGKTFYAFTFGTVNASINVLILNCYTLFAKLISEILFKFKNLLSISLIRQKEPKSWQKQIHRSVITKSIESDVGIVIAWQRN